MPIFECSTAQGAIDAEQRRRIAEGVTNIHHEETQASEPFIRVLFYELPEGYSYTAGKSAPSVILAGGIRAGRSEEVRKKMFDRMHNLLREVTSAPAGHIVISLVDFPSRWAMEAGYILPEPNPEAEAAWMTAVEKAGITP